MSNPAKFLNPIEKIGLFLFTMVFFLSIFVLVNEEKIFKREVFGDKIAVAVIKEFKNNVKIKGEKDIDWKDPKVGENLYQSDQIFTEKFSTAKIVFMDGSEFNIEENTFVVISSNNSMPNLSLKQGYLSAKSRGQFSIQLGNNHTVNFEEGDSEVDLKIDKNQKVNIDVFKGKSLVASDDESYELNSSQSVSIDKNNKKEITTAPLKILQPEDSTNISLKKLDSIKFLWKKHEKAAQYAIEIFYEDEEKSVFSKQINDNSIMHKLERFGKYQWKVSGLDKQRNVIAEAGPLNFEISENLPPGLKTPTIDDVIFPKRGPKYSVISFNWEDPKNELSTYEFKIAKDEEFNQLIFKKIIDDKNLSIDLEDGTYFWKVRRISKEFGDSDWTPSKTFSFVGQIAGLQLVFPGNNVTLETTGDGDKEEVKFEWKDTKNKFSSYVVIVSSDSEFKDIITQKESEERFLVLSLSKFKSYYWRVDGALDTGKIIPSITGRFNLGISQDMIPEILTKEIYFEF